MITQQQSILIGAALVVERLMIKKFRVSWIKAIDATEKTIKDILNQKGGGNCTKEEQLPADGIELRHRVTVNWPQIVKLIKRHRG